MTYNILFHPKAETELLESAYWYLKRSKITNSKFKDEFGRIIILIQNNPLLFPITFENKRKANLSKFPYSIIYSINNQNISILSVFHASRNPKIWKER